MSIQGHSGVKGRAQAGNPVTSRHAACLQARVLDSWPQPHSNAEPWVCQAQGWKEERPPRPVSLGSGRLTFESRPAPWFGHMCLGLRWLLRGWEWGREPPRDILSGIGDPSAPQGAGAFPACCPSKPGVVPAWRPGLSSEPHPIQRSIRPKVLTPWICVLSPSCLLSVHPNGLHLDPGHHQGHGERGEASVTKKKPRKPPAQEIFAKLWLQRRHRPAFPLSL